MGPPVRKEQRSESIFRIPFGSAEKAPGGVIPYSIYTVLPYLYVCAGFLTIFFLGNWIAVVSGLAWFSAAGITWVRRHRYRSPFKRSGGHIDFPTVINDDGPGEEVVQIYWQSSFECGHSIIDAQHRRLFGIGNLLVKAVVTKRLPGDIAWLLDELVDHMTDHFCTEEAVLFKAKHPSARRSREFTSHCCPGPWIFVTGVVLIRCPPATLLTSSFTTSSATTSPKKPGSSRVRGRLVIRADGARGGRRSGALSRRSARSPCEAPIALAGRDALRSRKSRSTCSGAVELHDFLFGNQDDGRAAIRDLVRMRDGVATGLQPAHACRASIEGKWISATRWNGGVPAPDPRIFVRTAFVAPAA